MTGLAGGCVCASRSRSPGGAPPPGNVTMLTQSARSPRDRIDRPAVRAVCQAMDQAGIRPATPRLRGAKLASHRMRPTGSRRVRKGHAMRVGHPVTGTDTTGLQEDTP